MLAGVCSSQQKKTTRNCNNLTVVIRGEWKQNDSISKLFCYSIFICLCFPCIPLPDSFIVFLNISRETPPPPLAIRLSQDTYSHTIWAHFPYLTVFGGSFVIVILKTNGIHHMMHSNIDLPGFLIYFLLTTDCLRKWIHIRRLTLYVTV